MHCFYEAFSCHTSFCFYFLYIFSNFSSHYSYKKVFLLPVPHLSLTAFCPLFLRPVCHVVIFPHKRHLVTSLLASCFSHMSANLSKSRSLDTRSPFQFSCSNASFFYSCSCPDSSHKTTRNGTTQRLLNGQ